MYSSFNAGGEESGASGDNTDETQLPFLRGVTLLEGGWVDNVLQVGELRFETIPEEGKQRANKTKKTQTRTVCPFPFLFGSVPYFKGLVLSFSAWLRACVRVYLNVGSLRTTLPYGRVRIAYFQTSPS